MFVYVKHFVCFCC